MGFGFCGYHCEDCKAEWNAIWSSVTMDFPSTVCPNCTSDKIKKLGQTVPFKINDGLPPDHVYHCICGKVFQKQPSPDFNPYEKDPEKLRKQLRVVCPFCKRANQHELPWYIPE